MGCVTSRVYVALVGLRNFSGLIASPKRSRCSANVFGVMRYRAGKRRVSALSRSEIVVRSDTIGPWRR